MLHQTMAVMPWIEAEETTLTINVQKGVPLRIQYRDSDGTAVGNPQSIATTDDVTSAINALRAELTAAIDTKIDASATKLRDELNTAMGAKANSSDLTQLRAEVESHHDDEGEFATAAEVTVFV